ncbi:baseplate J/gp47 family protein [Andreesenia angusta]|nr:baseplate J/gp47 family protein [Andreesenia angusta]
MDVIQSVSREFKIYYSQLKYIEDQAYIDTAVNDGLDRKALDHNITRKNALSSEGEVEFTGTPGALIDSGVVLSSDTLKFSTIGTGIIAKDGKATIKVRCMDSGTKGNVPIGAITKIDNAQEGLKSVTNLSALEGGADIEDDESLRDRVLFHIRKPITSGNKYHYEEWARENVNVGKVKVYPLWNGPGTVKVSVLNRDYGTASPEVLSELKQTIDPVDGMGEGKAPVGAVVTISTAIEVSVNIAMNITYKDGAVASVVNGGIKENLVEYLRNIGYSDKQVVSYAQIGYLTLIVEDVADYTGLTLNIASDNIAIGEEQIAILGELMINGEVV